VVFPRILEVLGDVSRKKILDFGCGQGRFSRAFNDRGAAVTGYDSSGKELHIASNLNDGREIVYSSERSALKRDNYDVVLCFMVLLCNKKNEVRHIVKEIYDVTKGRGKCIFVNTNTDTLGRRFKDFYSIVPDDMKEGVEYRTIIPTSKGDICVTDHYYSRDYLRAMFATHGFEVETEEIIADQFVLHVARKP
jgi:SAM-dependent methyltransferase